MDDYTGEIWYKTYKLELPNIIFFKSAEYAGLTVRELTKSTNDKFIIGANKKFDYLKC